jgi:hypothetical protein
MLRGRLRQRSRLPAQYTVYSLSSSHPPSFSPLRAVCGTRPPRHQPPRFLGSSGYSLDLCQWHKKRGATAYSQAAPRTLDGADLMEALEQANSRNHGYGSNCDGCKNPIHQPVDNIVFSIVLHFSLSLANHARRNKCPHLPIGRASGLCGIPFAGVALIFSLAETRKGVDVDNSVLPVDLFAVGAISVSRKAVLPPLVRLVI